MDDITAGTLLIADPFLKDPNFARSVVLMCEHKEEGSFGFVLNKKHDQQLGDLLEGFESSVMPVYFGGPVQLDTLHFIHQCPHLIDGGFEVAKGIFWGGDFDTVLELLKADLLDARSIRFFIGYSGWSSGQLSEEMKIKSWLITNATRKIIFPSNVDDTWNEALRHLGGEYVQLINYPRDPQLN